MTGPSRDADLARLASATPGSTVRVVAVPAENAASLAQQGIVPSAVLAVEKHVGLGGPVVVRSGRARLAVARPVAREIEVDAGPAAPKVDPAAEPKSERAAEPKVDPAAEPKIERAAEPKPDPAAEPKPPAQGSTPAAPNSTRRAAASKAGEPTR